MKFDELKLGTWYWVSGRGPMRLRATFVRSNVCSMETFSGMNYSASIVELVSVLAKEDLDRHTEETLRVFPIRREQISEESLEYLKAQVKKSANVTLGEVVEAIMQKLRTTREVTPEQSSLFNLLIPQVFPLARYGTVCTVSRVITAITDANEEESCTSTPSPALKSDSSSIPSPNSSSPATKSRSTSKARGKSD